MIVGYKLIRIEDGSVMEQWGGIWGQCPAIPSALFLPDLIQVHGPELDKDYHGYMLVAWEMWDPRFYVDGKDIQKDHDTLVAEWIPIVNAQAYNLLLPSDWMVIRKQENGTEIPPDWAQYRTDVRTVAEQTKAALIAELDFDAFVVIASNIPWPVSP